MVAKFNEVNYELIIIMNTEKEYQTKICKLELAEDKMHAIS